MGRRKIEIKAIKDDRNRSVTFLKRKGGLFKKAHELSVLCSVDVAVIIFGSNKKLYEYSSNDMRELITRYTYHGGPNEHKGPGDFNGGDDASDDEAEVSPPPSQGDAVALDGQHLMPPHYPGQQPPAQFAQFRHHTPSASPPIPNGAAFGQQHSHPGAGAQVVQRGHTPQPSQGGSRPASRTDMRRMPSQGAPHPSPGHPVNGYAYIPHPAIYNPQAQQPGMPQNMQQGMPQNMPHNMQGMQGMQGMQQNMQNVQMQQPNASFAYAPPPTTLGPPQAHLQAPYVDGRPASLPPSFPPSGPQPAGSSLPPPPHVLQRHSVSPQPHQQQLPPHHAQGLPRPSPPQTAALPPPLAPPQQPAAQANMGTRQPSPPQQQQQQQLPPQPQIQEPEPPTPVEPKTEATNDWPEVKKLTQRTQYSIFTPIDESRSILSQHLAHFRGEQAKTEQPPARQPAPPAPPGPPAGAVASDDSSDSGNQAPAQGHDASSRPQSVDPSGQATARPTPPPPTLTKKADGASVQMPQPKSRVSISSIPDTIFTPPSRSSSLRPGGGPLRPRLRVEIPPDGTEDNSGPGTVGSESSPRPGDGAAPGTRRNGETHPGMVLPPPSPSASALLSAGATGPPNPFARPPPHQSSSSNSNSNSNSSSNSNMNSNNNSNSMHIDTPGSALPSRFLNHELLPSPSSFYPDWGFNRGGDSATLVSPLNFATPVVGTGPSFLRDDHLLSNKRKSPEASAGAGTNASAAAADALEHNNEPKRVKVDS